MVMNDSLLEGLEEVELPPKDVPQTTKDALSGLGRTVLTAIDSVIAMAITQYTTQLANLWATQITTCAEIVGLRAQAEQFEKTLDQLKQSGLQYLESSGVLKYLELFPEIRTPIQEAINFIYDLIGQVESITEDFKRLTYTNDYMTSAISEITNQITELVQLRNLLKSLLG